MSLSFAVVLLGLAAFACAAPGEGFTLVLLDKNSIKDSHSEFFNFLKESGLKLKFSLADSSSLSLFKYGERSYDNLIVFAPSTEVFGGNVNKTIMKFVDEGGNLLLAASEDARDAVRDIAREVGFDMDIEGTQVIDHASNADNNALLVKSSNFVAAPAIVGQTAGASVLFRGLGMVKDEGNPLALEIITGSSTAYSYSASDEIKDYPHAVGKNTVLVGGLQARNNARVVVSGSLDFFSNEFFARSDASNKQIAQSIAKWTFQQSGVLRVRDIYHHRVGENFSVYEYTVSETVEYSLFIDEKVNGKWVPYNGKDVQLEFVRIDPFVRTLLKNENGRFSVTFALPDVYGVFQFKINYKRHGYTYLLTADQVSVRPLRHTQYERFLPAAYPYYAGALSMMAGLFIFSFVFLHQQNKDKLE